MNESRPQLIGMLAGLFLAAGLVMSAMLGTSAWMKIKNSQFITVKGSVQKNIESDLAIWSGTFQAEAATLLDAQHLIQANRALVAKFMGDNGVTNCTFTPINIEELKATQKGPDGFVSQRTTGYRLTQSVSLQSGDVDRLDKLDSTPLVEQGVIFTVAPVQFIYTKAGETKIEMLAAATRDARARAEQIASQGGRSLARLQGADQGIFQITPLHGNTTSWQGESDTSSREKTITAVVTATFLLK
jgi:uncharacterized protein